MQNVAPEVLQELTGKSGKGRRLAQRFFPLIKPVRFLQGATEDAVSDLHVSDHLKTYLFGLRPPVLRRRLRGLHSGIVGNGSIQRLTRPQIAHLQSAGEGRDAEALIVSRA